MHHAMGNWSSKVGKNGEGHIDVTNFGEEDNSGFEYDPNTQVLKEEGASNFFDNVVNTVSEAGEWVVDAVTGGLKWVQDNADAIMEAQEAAIAEEQKLLATPMEKLSLDEIEKRVKIELEPIEEKWKKWKEDELRKIPENMPEMFKTMEEEGIDIEYERQIEEERKKIRDEYQPYVNLNEAGFTDLIAITDTLEDSDVKDVVSTMLGLTMNEDGAFSDTASWSEVVFIPDEEAADEFYKKYVDDPEALAEINKTMQEWEARVLALPIAAGAPAFGLVLEGAAWVEDAMDSADITNNSTYLTDKLNEGSYYVKYNTSSTFNGMGSTTNNTVLCEVDENGNVVEPPHLICVYKHLTGNPYDFAKWRSSVYKL